MLISCGAWIIRYRGVLRMRVVIVGAFLALVAAPAEARHRHHHYVARCWPGEILLVHEGRCVWARSRAARDIGRSVPRFAAWPNRREVMPPDKAITTIPRPDTRPASDQTPERAKKGDRLPAVGPGPGIELPFWEPFPIMGRPQGRWWWL